MPEASAALLAMGKAVDDAGLSRELTELVKLRISQINGCAFCIALHLGIARRIGIDDAKVASIEGWQHGALFSPREKAALAFAEHLTGMRAGTGSRQAFAALLAHFSQEEAVQLTVAIANINTWNRISGGLGFLPPKG
ncbi:carboxymuconolactone decarboxylase family protein [Acuticoccus sp. MNP-M23]|uniref:carboxymuconolactone decarboxylase family protein n=1 Tax=Acuticoccus sp. MNP-M23 TaxID=3072793 RepID=UPI0028160DE2|nr:carboxymuconolactone decarboxylase family protein [Acuticoccus sp. MNP-M23]WMS45021.1 carboxymuconolactone decarboxylase family protein [Acuticoccus sp. MNP-M23]